MDRALAVILQSLKWAVKLDGHPSGGLVCSWRLPESGVVACVRREAIGVISVVGASVQRCCGPSDFRPGIDGDNPVGFAVLRRALGNDTAMQGWREKVHWPNRLIWIRYRPAIPALAGTTGRLAWMRRANGQLVTPASPAPGPSRRSIPNHARRLRRTHTRRRCPGRLGRVYRCSPLPSRLGW